MKSTSFFSLRTFAGNSGPQVPAEGSPLWAAYRELDRSQWFPAAEIERLQMTAVRSLLAHCLEHVPYYRERLLGEGVAPQNVRTWEDFRRLPILQRRVYQERYADFQALHLPPATYYTGVTTTSGTSGLPIEVMLTNVSQKWWLALYLRDLEWCGIDPRGTLAVIRPRPWAMTPEQKREFQNGAVLPCWHPALDDLIETGPSHGMDIHEDQRRHLAWLRRIAPQYLFGYPSHLDFLGSLIAESGAPLHGLRAIQTVSEALPQDMQARIEHAFGAPVKQLYSCGEAGYLASPCPAGHGLHVHAEHVILEVLDADGQPCKPGERGRVVLTNLHNYLTPFIRYEIMDEATLGPKVCPCGRGLPLLARLDGKCRPLLRLPNGRVKHSDGLGRDIRYVPGLHQYQIVQRAVDEVLVRVVPGQGWTAFHPERIRHLVREFFEGPVRVAVEVLERLELPPGGKLVDVVVEVKEEMGQVAPPSPDPSKLAACPSGEEPRAMPQAARGCVGKTVLLGWELGAGLGHIRPLLYLARALAARGFRPVFAVKKLKEAQAALQGEAFPVFQAPQTPSGPRSGGQPGPAASYADILARQGYADVEKLETMVQAWQGLLDEVKPDLVVCEHSPTLCLACYGAQPTIILGNGFLVPPGDQANFPLLLPGQALLFPEATLLAVVWEVQRRRQRTAPETLPGLLAGGKRFITVLPELDPYQARRTEPRLGPLDPLPPPTPLPTSPSYFAYLSADFPGVDRILAGLARTGIPGRAFVRGASPAQRGILQRPGLEILAGISPLAEVLPQVSVVVHHAGCGMAQQALAAGRPQLLFPFHLEQILNAQMVHGLGVGHYLAGQFTEEAVTRDLQALVADRRFGEKALARANVVQAAGPWDPIPRIVDHCFALFQQEGVFSTPN